MVATTDSASIPCPQADSGTQQTTSGLTFSVCERVEEVEEAWGLVYSAYLRAGLISPNPAELHLVPHAVSNDSVVIRGTIGGLTVSTMSAYLDGPAGLPLDRVYRHELDGLRTEGRHLLEMGLFADRRAGFDRSLGALFELMRWVCYFGVNTDHYDAIIGVHPHHAKFYTRMLGFKQLGEQRSYDTVNGNPVVMLWIDWAETIQTQRLPRGLIYLRDNPLPAKGYAQRVRWPGLDVQSAAVDLFLDHYGTKVVA